MVPPPIAENREYCGSGKLEGKVAIITGGDSGIGRAAAIAFAKEGADVVIVYLNEHRDAKATKERIAELGQRCLAIAGDLRDEAVAGQVAAKTMDRFGRIDILVNNHGVQFPQCSILDITAEQLDNTFRTNIYGFFYLTKAVLPHLSPGSAIINTTSVTAYEGNQYLIDYSATKGAISQLYPFVVNLAGWAADSCQCRRAGAGLDPAAAGQLAGRLYYHLWHRNTNAPGRAAV